MKLNEIFLLKIGEGPYFVKELTKPIVDEGEILVLECEVKGNPMPKVTWYHDKRIIKDSRNMRLKTIKEIGFTQLTIFEIYKDDEGEIKCVAENKFGKIESKTKIDVIGNQKNPIKKCRRINLKFFVQNCREQQYN